MQALRPFASAAGRLRHDLYCSSSEKVSSIATLLSLRAIEIKSRPIILVVANDATVVVKLHQ
jgi:hypothetical protein